MLQFYLNSTNNLTCMKRIALYIFVFIGILSCTEKKSKKKLMKIEDIKTFNIKSTEIELNEMPMFPKGCRVIDSTLILFEPKLTDGFLSLYSLKSNTLIKRFGEIGNGPCDFINPRFFQNYQFKNDEKSFLIADSKYFYKLNIDSIITGYNNCKNSIIEYVPAEMKGYNYILNLSDTYITANVTGNSQVEQFNLLNKERKSMNYYPKLSGLDINDLAYSTQIYDAYYTSNNENIIIAYKHLKQIDILSLNGDYIKSIYFLDFDINLNKIRKIDDYNVKFEDNSLFFYSYIFTTDSYFYALCWNSTKNEIKENKAIPEIQIFNQRGEIINILKPDIAISYFCVDEKESKIYAIGMSSDEDLKVYTFNKP